ncbi:MAG: hypothetical protein WAM62_11440 [Pseudolabrys sp.]
MLTKIRELIWPMLETYSSKQMNELLLEQNAQIKKIESLKFGNDIDAALAMAERIYTEEGDRSKAADNKAFQYLLVAAAIISLLTYLESSIWDGKLGTAPKWLTLLILLAAVLYLVRAALHALKAVSSRIYHVVGAADVPLIWGHRSPKSRLIKDLLVATLKNQEGINAKVSSVKLATAFLSRTIVAFGFLLFFQISWEVSGLLGPSIMTHLRLIFCGS